MIVVEAPYKRCASGIVLHRELLAKRPDTFRLWPSHYTKSGLTAVGPNRYQEVPVPDWFIAAWHAGEPLNGLLDWLIENRGDEHPWLADLINRIEWPASAEDD